MDALETLNQDHRQGTSEAELQGLKIIRTETVFSRLPIHQLSKRGKIDIRIIRRDRTGGQISLYWRVSPNAGFGEPRQLAYKLDTLIVNRRLDDLGRPLPRIIRVGSLHAIAQELGLGRNTDRVKKIFRQNALVGITARLAFKNTDGKEESIDATFTRYNVVFRGQELPDGKRAETVYLILNDPYFHVVNTSVTRPQDYDYLAELPPTAQRFYELAGYKIFAALKNGYPEAKLSYAEFCTAAPQNRYFDYDHLKKQMYKVHRPHLKSGYIAKVRYEATTDPEGKLDWSMHYVPGPKARTEYGSFSRPNLGRKPAAPKPIIPGIGRKGVGCTERSPKEMTQAAPQQESGASHAAGPLQTVQRFHELARGAVDYAPGPGSREVKQAEELLKKYGPRKVNFVLDFAVRSAERTKFHMRTFGAVFQYVPEALTAYDKIERREQEARRVQSEREERERREEAALKQAEERLNSLGPEQHQSLYEVVKADLAVQYPHIVAWKGAGVFEAMIKLKMVQRLDERGQQELRGKA